MTKGGREDLDQKGGLMVTLKFMIMMIQKFESLMHHI
jgi:hypothetical protein